LDRFSDWTGTGSSFAPVSSKSGNLKTRRWLCSAEWSALTNPWSASHLTAVIAVPFETRARCEIAAIPSSASPVARFRLDAIAAYTAMAVAESASAISRFGIGTKSRTAPSVHRGGHGAAVNREEDAFQYLGLRTRGEPQSFIIVECGGGPLRVYQSSLRGRAENVGIRRAQQRIAGPSAGSAMSNTLRRMRADLLSDRQNCTGFLWKTGRVRVADVAYAFEKASYKNFSKGFKRPVFRIT
jgi:hypothetical protein